MGWPGIPNGLYARDLKREALRDFFRHFLKCLTGIQPQYYAKPTLCHFPSERRIGWISNANNAEDNEECIFVNAHLNKPASTPHLIKSISCPTSPSENLFTLKQIDFQKSSSIPDHICLNNEYTRVFGKILVLFGLCPESIFTKISILNFFKARLFEVVVKTKWY